MSKRIVRAAAVFMSVSLVLVVASSPRASGRAAAMCFGQAVTVDLGVGQVPSNGDDVIVGTPGDDVIDAMRGDDIVCGGAGNDRLLGRGGNDVLVGGPGNDIAIGNAGNDRLVGGPGRDRLIGGPGRDVLRGGGGPDAILGGDDRDPVLTGGAGNDTIDGGDGRDTIYGNAGDDVLNGGNGSDELRGGAGDDRVNGDTGDDFLAGNQDSDVCDGGIGGETAGDRAAATCETVLNAGPSASGCRPDATICVGTGQNFETLAAAVGSATNGSIIEVQFGTYDETVAVMANNVTIRAALGNKPTVDCSGIRPAWGKACILAVGTNLTVERLRVTGARWTSGNEACFRNEPNTRVILRGVHCSGSNNGILGSGGSWLVVNSTFVGNGAGDGQTHNLYFSGDCSSVVARGITSSVSNGGHAFKSRCRVSTIEDSTLVENSVADGADFSDGGIATIRNSRIEQPDGANGNMIRHGSESCSNGGRLRIEGSTIVSGRTPSYIRSTCAHIQIVTTQLPSGVILLEP